MAEEKTIIIKNEEENKSNFTFKNYIRSIKLFKYWILGISLLVGVFGYLVTSLGINKLTQKVSSTFTYSFPTTSYYAKEATLFTGDVINISSISSTNNITEVYENTLDEEGNKVFTKLNLQDIIDNSDIALETSENTYTVRTKEDPVSSDTFTLSAKVKPFKNSKLASRFLEELINLIPSQVNNMLSNYRVTNEIMHYGNSEDTSFAVSVSLINSQYDIIIDKYVSLRNYYGTDYYVPSENKTIAELELSFYDEYKSGSSNLVNEIESVLHTKGYANYTLEQKESKLQELNSSKAALEKEKEDKTKEKNNLESIISSFQYVNIDSNSTINTSSPLSYKFAVYVERLESVNKRIDTIDKNLALIDKQITNVTTSDSTYVSDCATFKKRVNDLLNKLSDSTNKISSLITTILKSKSANSVNFATSTKVELKGNIPPILVALIGLVLGFVVSSLIYTYYYVNFLLIEEEKTKPAKKNNTPKETTE